MYHLMVFLDFRKCREYGLSFDKLKHYYLSSANDVFDVLCSLNHLSDLVYTIEKIDFVSVSDVIKDFEIKEV